MSGLLVEGVEIEVPGLRIVNVHDQQWAKLHPGDYRDRKTPWVRQIIVHTTKGKWPQRVLPGAGTAGAARIVSEFWRGDPTHSAAHLVVDRDGSVACLADVMDHTAFHATTSNEWSVGIEMYQESDGGIFEAVLASTVLLVEALCLHVGIPFQLAADSYREGSIIERMKDGGRDCIGIFGHRNQAWMFPEWMSPDDRAKYPHGYSSRGRGDPGDDIFQRLIAAGAEPLNFGVKQDLEVWRPRQRRLNLWGEKLTEDGVCGPGTMIAMKKLGFQHGREIDAAVEDPRG